MVISGAGLVTRNFALILAPAYASNLLMMLLFSGGLSLAGWLMVRGIDVPRWKEQVEASHA